MEDRIKSVISILKKTYPKAKIVLKYSNNWELLVAVILSAQCTDKKVNEVTSILFSKYRISKLKILGQRPISLWLKMSKPHLKSQNEELQEINNFATVDVVELERDIKPTGFYRNKAKNIQGAARKILENFAGKLPKSMSEMLTIPGIARKSANVILGNAYGIIEGIAVDTHVSRLSQRLRLVKPDTVGGGKKRMYFEKNSQRMLDYCQDASPEKIENQLMDVIPKKDWFTLTYLLIDHGRAICTAQRPKCDICPVKHLCPASRV